MKLAAILAMLSGMLWTSPFAGSGPVRRVHASRDGLALVLAARVYGPVVIAQARLTNTASSPFTYYGGCAPPVLQIQTRDAAGHHVYGWVSPRVNCLALSVRHLAPGASIRKSAHFFIHGRVKVRAAVQVKVAPGYLFQTRVLTVAPR